MTGMLFCCGMPFSPWQAAQSCAFSAMVWAAAGSIVAASRASTDIGTELGRDTIATASLRRATKDGNERSRPACRLRLNSDRVASSIQREGDDVVAALVVDLDVAAGPDHDVLLAAHRVGGGRRIDAGAGVER